MSIVRALLNACVRSSTSSSSVSCDHQRSFVHSHSAPMHNKNNNIQREEISAQLLTRRLLLTCDASVPREKINVILSMRKKKMRNCRRRRKPCCVMMVTTNLMVELEGGLGGDVHVTTTREDCRSKRVQVCEI